MPGVPPELLEFVCYDNNNNEVRLFPPEPQPHGHRREGGSRARLRIYR